MRVGHWCDALAASDSAPDTHTRQAAHLAVWEHMRNSPAQVQTREPLPNGEDVAARNVRGEVNGGSVRRTFDPAFLNIVVNHPAVRPSLEGDGVLDVSHQVSSPDNFALTSESGGFLLIRHEPGRYEVHSQFLPGHATHPIRAMQAAQEWMFTRTDCQSIVSKIPDANRAAKGFAIAGGLRPIFRRDGVEYVELTLMDWAMRTRALDAHGERFHDLLQAAKIEAGSILPAHPHDAAHERAVGAALLMIERGQCGKGVAFYNRWARQAGYAEIGLISDSPPTVDAVDAVVGLGNNGLEVLLCR